jgi:hypothetical protein
MERLIDEAPLKRHERLRRVILLCGSSLRNLAYHSAGWDGKTPKFSGQVQQQINSNFIDVGVLEWCKLFGQPKHEPQHWEKLLETVKRRREFKSTKGSWW